jgi:hypothetical protein
MNDTLKRTSQENSNDSDLQPLELDIHILVLGQLALTYAAGNPKSPVRHWGGGAYEAGRSLRIGENSYSATRGQSIVDGKPVSGVKIRKLVGEYSKVTGWTEMFIPFEELENLHITGLKGVVTSG